ncbi:hypothetical protein [Nocardia transvalensis]|uniref:hypothetical protein n=1 Tax=Nocardia transvalensis TaxID=37333 RepID=UPI001894A515|nr:hypothetical protein [Nocardia transvalensis]MBF6331847.1 hypothetical protein [Nocardia transvalensis]
MLAKKRIGNDLARFTVLRELLAEACLTVEDPFPVSIETPAWADGDRAGSAGRPVYAINPMAVHRHRECHSVARAESDHADAMTSENFCVSTLICTASFPPIANWLTRFGTRLRQVIAKRDFTLADL